ncbi:MAG: UDP-N-acetylmuramoyl-L-alanine--D-glutamate ligase, partial [Halobacteriovoraceae bacterium]|nr:UDP-N-acetylmuramoyl-L-alanine--D-glutamate ligase [Halobacteriovoraceae bacterium]
DHALLRGIPCPIWNEIELASQDIQVPIIAVTGTNGKTTTVTMMGEILRAMGKEVRLGGNIGTPLCEIIERGEHRDLDVLILELSSFQLESLFDFHPQVAVFLNIFQNHGERYHSIEDYLAAKKRIANNLSNDDLLLYGPQTELADWAEGLNLPAVGSTPKLLEEFEAAYDFGQMKIPGAHNISNFFFAVQAIKHLFPLEKEYVQKVVKSFNGVEHRIEFVATDTDLLIYNDSKSTNWDATFVALDSMPAGELTLLLGGKLRGEGDCPPQKVIKLLRQRKPNIILFGEARQELTEIFENNKIPCTSFESLEDFFEKVKPRDCGDLLLLAPAFPSFDQFENYAKRGEVFKSLVSVWKK